MKPTRKHTPKFYIHHNLCHCIKLYGPRGIEKQLEVVIALAGLSKYPYLIHHVKNTSMSDAYFILIIDLWKDHLSMAISDLYRELMGFFPNHALQNLRLSPIGVHEGQYGFTLKDMQEIIKNA